MSQQRLILKGRRPRYQRIIHEYGDCWIVIDEKPEVSFSDIPGPWLYLRSANGQGTLWLLKENDPHYMVVKEPNA